MTQHLDDRLATWLADEPAPASVTGLQRAMVATRDARQRPGWLVAALGGTIGADRRTPSLHLSAIVLAVAALAILVGGMLIGGGLLPPVPPEVPPSEFATPSGAALPSAAPGPGLIAYRMFGPLEVGSACEQGATPGPRPDGCSRIWVSFADGSGAHELFPDLPGYQTPIEWSADGARLLFEDADGVWLSDPSGSDPQLISLEALCGDLSRCGPGGIQQYALSPDGTRLAYVRAPATPDPAASLETVISIMELATGQVTELATTYAAQLIDTGQPCGDLCRSGTNDPPHWSPDGTRLVFARQGIGPVDRPAGDGNGQPGDTIFTVNADGTDLRQLVPMELFAIEPRWSPDGSLITFISATPTGSDVHVVRPDGTGLRRMTTDGASIRPSWTSNRRLVFLRYPGGLTDPAGFEVWIMDADGQNSSELDPTNLAELTAAQCRSCPYLAQPETGFPDTAVWQPPR